jgi:hypothetical protein
MVGVTSDEPRETLTIGTDRRSTRGRLLLVLALVIVLGLAGYRLLGGSEPEAQAEDPVREDEPRSIPAPRPVTPDSSRLAYAVGRTLHLGDRELQVRGPGVTADTVVQLRGQVPTGWLVTLHPGAGRRAGAERSHGVVDDQGRFGPYRGVTALAGEDLALTSPDGTRVLAVVAGRSTVVDTASGERLEVAPPGRAVAWTDDGVYLLPDRRRTTAWVWQPGDGFARLRFDARACRGNLTAIAASIEAAWDRCRHADLVATSPSGEATLRADRHGVVTLDGQPVLPRVQAEADSSRMDLHRAAFLDENTVLLDVTERVGGGLVTALVECSAGSVCLRVGDVIPAAQRVSGSFLVMHECDHSGGRTTGISRQTADGGPSQPAGRV